MSDDPEKPEMDDATLDGLLAEARWPEPGRSSEKRLAAYFRSLNRPMVSPRWLVAASVMLVAGIWMAIHLSRGNRQPPVQIGWLETHVPAHQTEEPDVLRPLDHEALSSRPPTALELALVATVDREADRASAAVPLVQAPDPVAGAVEAVVANPSGESMAGAREMLATVDFRTAIDGLIRQIRTGDPTHRAAAATLLEVSVTPYALAALLELDRTPALRDAVVPSLSRIAPPEVLVELARSHTDPSQQRVLIAGLLHGGQGEREYLELVADSQLSASALSALDVARPVSTDAFFAALYDPHISVRLAAARVLGRIDGPQTTARLVAMAERNQSRREALIALADSRGTEARQFLLQARTGGPLAGVVRSILLDQSLND